MSLSKDYRDHLKKEGFVYSRTTGRNHQVWTDGTVSVTIPNTPSDGRGFCRMKADINRLRRRAAQESKR